MDEILILITMTATCIFTYLISYIFIEVSTILFGLTLMGIFSLQNNFILLFVVFLMAGLLILRIFKLSDNRNFNFKDNEKMSTLEI